MIKRAIKSIIPAQGVVAQFGCWEPAVWSGDRVSASVKITYKRPVICWALMEQSEDQYMVGMAIFDNGDIDACDSRDDFLGYKTILDEK